MASTVRNPNSIHSSMREIVGGMGMGGGAIYKGIAFTIIDFCDKVFSAEVIVR